MVIPLHQTKRYLIPLFIGALFLLFIPIALSNPIPVYPDPRPDYQLPTVISSSNSFFGYWLLFVFLLDFAIDVLMMYAGLYVLSKHHNSSAFPFFEDFSRLYFTGSVLFISLIGIFTEWLIGMWTGGVLITLCIIFLSFYIVSKKLFHLSTHHSIFMGTFAVTINGISWVVIFSL
jgi:hypothetical protein